MRLNKLSEHFFVLFEPQKEHLQWYLTLNLHTKKKKKKTEQKQDVFFVFTSRDETKQ